jgi:hypothetical protein
MNMLDDYSQRWVQHLERRKAQIPYSFIWCLLGLGGAFFLFGFVDDVWEYFLEGSMALGAAAVLFVIEACWRRISELKMFLSEYVEANRNRGAEPLEELSPDVGEEEMELADREESSQRRSQEFEAGRT